MIVGAVLAPARLVIASGFFFYACVTKLSNVVVTQINFGRRLASRDCDDRSAVPTKFTFDNLDYKTRA
jgi:hypothetical protein